MRILRKNWLVIALFLVIFFTRLLIFNKDAADYFPDEWRYYAQIKNIEMAVSSGDYLLVLRKIFDLNARPGFGIFYFPPSFLEWKYPEIPFGQYYNLLVSISLVGLIFLIVRKIENDKTAILATLLVGLSISSVIYMRHLLPWDLELALMFFSLYVYLRTKNVFYFGLLLGVSFFTYPSFYYYMLPIPIILLLWHKKIWSIARPLQFVAGIATVLLAAQLFSASIGAVSYWNSLKAESAGARSVEQGDYISAWSFLNEYIQTTDGIWFVLLVASSLVGFIFINKDKKLVIFSVYLVMTFLILEATSHLFSTQVLYGRTARPFYLLMLIFCAIVLNRLFMYICQKARVTYSILFFSIILITVVSWWPHFVNFKNLVYPKQFHRKSIEYLNERYQKYDIVTNNFDTAFVNFWNTDSPFPNFLKSGRVLGVRGKFYTINTTYLYPYYGNYDLDLYCNAEVLLEESHVATAFQAYLLEGYKRVMRQQMINDPVKYQLIYCKD